MSLVAGVRWSFRGKDAGSARSHSATGATEGAVLGASSAARRHSVISSTPPNERAGRRGSSEDDLPLRFDHAPDLAPNGV
jgi:hypothetical protein